jgi:hypothetical protein
MPSRYVGPRPIKVLLSAWVRHYLRKRFPLEPSAVENKLTVAGAIWNFLFNHWTGERAVF